LFCDQQARKPLLAACNVGYLSGVTNYYTERNLGEVFVLRITWKVAPHIVHAYSGSIQRDHYFVYIAGLRVRANENTCTKKTLEHLEHFESGNAKRKQDHPLVQAIVARP
jgi:hypothetical protein